MKRRTIALLIASSFAMGGLSTVGAILARRAILRPAVAPAPLPPAPSPRQGRLVVAGNSLTVDPFPGVLGRLLGPHWQVVGRGVSSQTTSQMIATGGEIDRLIVPSTRNALVVWEGTNDLFFGADAGTAIVHLRDYCKARKTAGWEVVLLTLLPRMEPGMPAAFEGYRLSVNDAIRSFGPDTVDLIVDVASDPLFADPGDLRVFRDGTHLTTLGETFIACRVAAAIPGRDAQDAK